MCGDTKLAHNKVSGIFLVSSDLRFVSNTLRFLTILYTDIRNTGCKVSPRC